MEQEQQHILTETQLEAIEREIKTAPLTSALLPIQELAKQYDDDNDADTPAKAGDGDSGVAGNGDGGFAEGSKYLARNYASFRRVRGDGNCYYRSFLYSLCESLLRGLMTEGSSDGSARAEFKRLKDLVATSLDNVCKYGYERMTIEMFHEELVEVLDFLEEVSKSTDDKHGATPLSSSEQALDRFHDRFNEENSTSDYCTWYLRVMTAAQMKSDPDRFLPFLLGEASNNPLNDVPLDIPTFCAREVEPMGRECGMVQVCALAEAMGMNVCIEYMDGKSFVGGGMLAKHEFGPSACSGEETKGANNITLLYRPGHYDILY